jgi:aminoglycoside 6'-N-acetyltransferase
MELVRKKYSSYIKGYKLVDGQQKPIQAFIIHNNQNPVGYIQIYNAYDFPRSKSLLGLPENLGPLLHFGDTYMVIGRSSITKEP